LKRNIVSPKTILTQSKKAIQMETCKWSESAIWQNNRIAFKAAVSVIDYIKETQPGQKILSNLFF